MTNIKDIYSSNDIKDKEFFDFLSRYNFICFYSNDIPFLGMFF